MFEAGDPDVIGVGGDQMQVVIANQEESEEMLKGVEQQALTQAERRLVVWLILISCIDLVYSGSIIVIALQHAYLDNGVSLYCLAAQAFAHFISSLLLVVRFIIEYRLPQDAPGIGVDKDSLRKARRAQLVREQGMSVCMGIVMLISSIALLFKAFRKMRFWDKWYHDHHDMDEDIRDTTIFLAWYGFVAYVIQAFVRWFCARKLRRSVLWQGFVASCVSLAFLFILGIAAVEESEWMWKAEPIAAMVLSIVTLAEGVRIIYNHFDDVDERLGKDPRA
mmetsp:Transcript_37730/g.59725  ORF Transcript_37730/g.59725 Transcript_37730/m.59725 type:complete len:278 (-) Transcript_37730:113-946(-)